MLSQADNDRLTRVGAGTPMGTFFRRYWIPAALSEEFPEPDGAPVRLRILGEDLVGFRDTEGNIGIVSAFCPHRRAPLFFGRNEECGIRCVYHGWKFDRTGACVDMPSEPPDSLFKTKVTIEAYPAWEGGGMVWTYMGPRELQPPPPDHELVRAPANHRHVGKMFEDCNFLQALEGGIDPTHATILHNVNIGDRSFLNRYDELVASLDIAAIWLVLDATTGQNGLEQARKFTESARVTGIVLTKLDGTAKGGVVVAIARELSLPIRFVGVGEKIDDLIPFDPEKFVESLFD